MLRGQNKAVSRAGEPFRSLLIPLGEKTPESNLGYCGPITHISKIHIDCKNTKSNKRKKVERSM
jgi:hypothetical protein